MAIHNRIIDGGEHFVIDAPSHQVTVPATHRVIGTEGDNRSEQITFKCPRIIDGHDVSQCARRYLNWRNVAGVLGSDALELKEITEDTILLAWVVRDGLTVSKGIVSFSVHFEDDPTEEQPDPYRWSTTTCKSCEILEGLNAVLNTYAAIYVVGDTLVIADYTKVEGDTLALNAEAIIPSESKRVTENGVHDVRTFAEVEVDVPFATPEITITESGKVIAEANGQKAWAQLSAPVLSISASGKITATANGQTAEAQLSAQHDADFTPENIKEGVELFGVRGTSKPMLPMVSGKVYRCPECTVGVYIPTSDGYKVESVYHTAEDPVSIEAPLGGFVVLVIGDDYGYVIERPKVEGAKLLRPYTDISDFYEFLIQITSDNFIIDLREVY